LVRERVGLSPFPGSWLDAEVGEGCIVGLPFNAFRQGVTDLKPSRFSTHWVSEFTPLLDANPASRMPNKGKNFEPDLSLHRTSTEAPETCA
jgi:hypothetical protein